MGKGERGKKSSSVGGNFFSLLREKGKGSIKGTDQGSILCTSGKKEERNGVRITGEGREREAKPLHS